MAETEQEIRYRFKNQLLSDQEIRGQQGIAIVVAGPAARGEGILEAFDSHGAFDGWAKEKELTSIVASLRKMAAESKRNQRQEMRRAEARHRTMAERIRRDLEELATESGLAIDSEQLFELATVNRPVNEPPIFRSAILYQDINFGGGWIPLAYTLPDFRWLGFNDLTSSYRWSAFGVGTLYEHIWYGGAQAWIFGPQSQPWIGNWFNDKASSGVIRYERGPYD